MDVMTQKALDDYIVRFERRYEAKVMRPVHSKSGRTVSFMVIMASKSPAYVWLYWNGARWTWRRAMRDGRLITSIML